VNIAPSGTIQITRTEDVPHLVLHLHWKLPDHAGDVPRFLVYFREQSGYLQEFKSLFTGQKYTAIRVFNASSLSARRREVVFIDIQKCFTLNNKRLSSIKINQVPADGGISQFPISRYFEGGFLWL